MTRIIEFALLAAPILAYVLFRVLLARGVPNPSGRTLAALGAIVLVLAAGLAWTALHERHATSSRYVPAQELDDGRIVPGHGT